MNLYFDSSAIVKRYILETDSAAARAQVEAASNLGTSMVAYAEVAAALARVARVSPVDRSAAAAMTFAFRADWFDMIRFPVDQATLDRAASLVGSYPLRGFDAVHLASALIWMEDLRAPVRFATFDRQLWRAARETGLDAWPAGLGDP